MPVNVTNWAFKQSVATSTGVFPLYHAFYYLIILVGDENKMDSLPRSVFKLLDTLHAIDYI